MANIGSRVEITVRPGTNPIPGETELKTLYFTDTDKVYFYNGNLRKLPGWVAVNSSNGQTLLGALRTIYSYHYLVDHYLLGTSKRLYTYEGGQIINITPFLTSSTAIANSLANDYVSLGSNPIATTNGSKNVVITSTAHKLVAGDSVTISGATATGGLTIAQLNTTFVVRSTTTNNFTVMAAVNATSTTTGGGAVVKAASAIITVTASSHGLVNGDRVNISGATAVGGVPAGEINDEHIIRRVTTNTFDFVASTKATSSVSSGGGAATVYYKPISAGEIDFSSGAGYGGGLYGVGLYGVSKSFANGNKYPRIWSIARFGNDVVMTPGEQGVLYIWQSSSNDAPTVLSGAPTAVNWVFVSNNIVVTLGASGVENRIKSSNVGDATSWTASASSLAYEDDVEGAGKFISQAQARGINLLFTENEVYSFTFVGLPDIWDTRLLTKTDGIIGPKARAEVQDHIFWMGQSDFYVYDGATITKINGNTCRDYIFANLNYTQAYKSFCRLDNVRNQIFFYFPFSGSSEPDHYVIYNYKEGHWTLGTMNRTAAEEQVLQIDSPYVGYGVSDSVAGVLYRHDIGHDDNAIPMLSYAETNYAMIGNGDNIMEIQEIIPDSTQTGNIDMTIYTKFFGQSAEEFTYGTYEITPTTEFADPYAAGRQRKYRLEQNALGEDFSVGKWFETIKPSASY